MEKVNKLKTLEKKSYFCIINPMSQTYQPKKRKRAKTHGFLVRSKSPTGRNVLKRRRQKGRAKLAV